MTDERVSARAWTMLAVLGMLYVLSFVDRFMLALLVAPLKVELALSDVQLGLLFGTYFAVFYGVMGLPLARIADRGNRKRLVIAGVLFWSTCTLASAFAPDYPTLAVLRFGLAIGEAALTPAAFSMLTDAFPHRRRMLAGTLFSASGMLGASLSFAIGAGVIAAARVAAPELGLSAWRFAFIVVGLPGFVLAALFAVVAPEPGRGRRDVVTDETGVVRYIGRHARLYGGLFAGAAAAQMLSYAIVAWSPTLLGRRYGLDIGRAGLLLGAASVFATVGGTLVVPSILRLVAARRPSVAGRVPGVAVAIGIALVVAALQSRAVVGFLVLNALGGFLVTGAINATVVVVQPIAPPAMRATLTALLLICISSIGLGVGPPLAAALAGMAGGGLQRGLTLLAAADLVMAGTALAVAARPLGRALATLSEGRSPPQEDRR